MSESVDAVVTLVHGTWARKDWENLPCDKRWPDMQAAIAEALQPKSLRIDTNFKWTGRNSVNARYEAASSFKKHVAELHIPDGVPHYVVAHSHGGSVVALALADESLRRKVTGLVCLSTPFFHVRARSRIDSGVLVRGLFAVVIVVVLWLFSGYSPSIAWMIAGTLVGAILVGILVAHILSSFSEHVLTKMRLPVLTDVPVLVVRAPADDTSLPLTAFQFFAWLAQWVYWFVNGAANLIQDLLGSNSGRELSDARRKAAAVTLVLLCVVCFALAVFQSDYGWTVDLLSFEATWQVGKTAWNNALAASFAGIMGSSGLALLAYLFAAGVAALTSVLVGPELAIAGLYMDASVETAPPGRCDFEQLSMSDAAPSKLQHATHSNAAAIARVAAWLKAERPESTTQWPGALLGS